MGGVGAVVSALVSRSSINKLATIGLMGDPIAAPLTCSNIFPWKVKYVVVRQNSKRQEIWFTVMVVLWCKFLSSSRSFLIIAIDGSIGTDVNNDSTSKDIIHSSGLSWMPSMLCMKSMLFLTWCDEPPTRGLMILANSLAVEWVTDPMLDMIGLSGIPGLCTLGNP